MKAKKSMFLAGILSMAMNSLAFATPLKTGSFSLYQEKGYQPNGFCDRGTSLALDIAKVKGNIAFLNDFVNGICEIVVAPNTRYYEVKTVRDGCGSLIHKGSRFANDGEHKIKIVDNRSRICGDIIAALVVVEEVGPQGKVTMYSFDK